MPAPRTSPLVLDARANRPEAVAAATAALRKGLLVVFPTETVYGLAADARSQQAIARLVAAIGGKPRPSAWHAPNTAAALGVLELVAPIHLRLITRLTPGPVTLVVERSEAELVAIRRRLAVAPGAIDDGFTIAVRIPDHAIAQELLTAASKAGLCIAAQGIAAAGWGTGGDGRALPDALLRPEPPTPVLGAIIDDGPTRLGRPSTAIRLLASGGYRIESEGALPARLVQRQAERTILFVCTGNTCRSPMAEAIARSLIGPAPASPAPGTPPPVPTRFMSAGASAYDGDPATPETIRALESLGIDAGSLSRHRSHALTAQMLDDADAVFAMTADHARAAKALNPAAASKIQILDPDGRDIADPIGGALEVYTRTAQRLQELIRRRLAELD